MEETNKEFTIKMIIFLALMLVLWGPAAYMGYYIEIYEPLKSGFLPLHPIAQQFGISDLMNLICFGIALLICSSIFIFGAIKGGLFSRN